MSTGHIIPGSEPGEGASGERAAQGPSGPSERAAQGPSGPSERAAQGPAAPEPSHAERARTLVASQTRGSLSTIAVEPAGMPFGSVVSYGTDAGGRPCFFVSTLAEHTRNLDADPRASLLVVEDTPDGADPLASGRVTLLGTATEVSDPDERSEARDGYLAANPAAFYVDYGDFRCLRLDVTSVRYVGGFGRMSWVDARRYAAAQPDPLAPAAAGIVGHMNADHASALVTLCHHYGGRDDVLTASMTAVDRYGLDVVADLGDNRRQTIRIGFRTEQVAPDDVRRELVAMLAEARSRTT